MWSCPTAEPDSLMLRPQAQRRGQADRQKVPSGQYAHGTKIPILHTEDKLEGSLLRVRPVKYISDCQPRFPC